MSELADFMAMERQIRDFGEEVSYFAEAHQLPDELFTQPDHVVFKAADIADFESRVKTITPWSEVTTFIEADDRFLVAAHTVVDLVLLPNRKFNWVQVIEPKDKEKRPQNADFTGLEYAEFHFPNFEEAHKLMLRKGLDALKRHDGRRRWLQLALNPRGQQLRISDRRIADTLQDELEQGIAKVI
jgi:hypothetical protein